MEILIPFLLLCFCALFCLLNLVGAPGNWLIVFACILYDYMAPHFLLSTLGWAVILSLAGIALAGELLELAASAAGLAKGGSKRGAVLSILGSILGSIVGGTLGSVVPIIGTIVGLLLGASLGAMLGAIVGEYSLGKPVDVQFEVGFAAFWGRFWGTIGKMCAGAVMFFVLLVVLIF